MAEPKRSIGRLVVPAALALLALLVWLSARAERRNLAAQLVEDVEKAAADPLVRTSHLATPLPGTFGERVDSVLAGPEHAGARQLLDAPRAQSARPPRGLGLYAPPDLAAARRLSFRLASIGRDADGALATGRADEALDTAVGLLAFARDRSYFDPHGSAELFDGAATLLEKSAAMASESARAEARSELQRIATGFPSPLQLARYRRPCVRARALGFVLDASQRARLEAIAPRCRASAAEPRFLPMSLRRVRRAFADHDAALASPASSRGAALAARREEMAASGDPLLRVLALDVGESVAESAAAAQRDATFARLLHAVEERTRSAPPIDPPPPAP